jgi:N-acetyl-gamma-glutamyl-phosphate reductase
LVSVPGCYPTAATLALKPLADAGLLSGQVAPIVSAVSGVSGAGKKAQTHTQFCEVSLSPYGVHTHRHQPEIAQNIAGPVVFTPHLGNFNRGILASCYAYLNKSVKIEDIAALYNTTYASHKLIRLLPKNEWPAIKNVAYTPCADLAFSLDEPQQQVSVFVAIDNLLKGAASQAVQLLNLQQGFASHTGLIAGA